MRSSARVLLAASVALVFALTGCATPPADDMLGEPAINTLPAESPTGVALFSATPV